MSGLNSKYGDGTQIVLDDGTVAVDFAADGQATFNKAIIGPSGNTLVERSAAAVNPFSGRRIRFVVTAAADVDSSGYTITNQWESTDDGVSYTVGGITSAAKSGEGGLLLTLDSGASAFPEGVSLSMQYGAFPLIPMWHTFTADGSAPTMFIAFYRPDTATGLDPDSAVIYGEFRLSGDGS